MTKFNQQDQQSLVNILLRYWGEITAIEQEFALLVGKGDMRPRIDYFHDAIRAFTSPHKSKAMEKRLSVEQLSYDVRCLHYIATMPLASITHDAQNFSPSTLPAVIAPGLVETSKRINRDTKEKLCELYQQYGVLFAALLKATAENDAHDRTDALNQDVEEISALIDALSNNASAQQITTLINHLTDEALKQNLLLLLPQIKGKSAGALNALVAKLRANIQKNDKRIKGIDSAHHAYVTTQLVIYENAKDMLKKMAGQGMNLVGQFVESTLRGTQAGRGR